ncbi:MAG TPA: tripartite tricarboxylate transporter substrate binding protein [Ramlibacter sp.]|nr:tripartite tricarboxylate transporter substrate binding protein [Ramlibacter sp.]
MKRTIRTLAFAVLAAFALHAWAQGRFPERQLTLVAPFPAGASTDAFARLIASRLSANLGQQVVVENRPGASGNVAGQYVARGPADGHRILVATHPMITVNPHVFKEMGFDPLKDLRPVANGINTINVVAVHPSLPVRNIAELIAWGKANPGELFFGTAGAGTPHHMGGMELGRRAGLPMKHVAYRGGAPMLADLAGGQIRIGITGLNSAESLANAGKIRIIAVGEAARVAAYPNIPTMAESFPGLLMNGWTGFFVPAATPPAVADRLSKELLDVMNQPAVAKQLEDLRIPLWPARDPQALATQIAADYRAYAAVVRDLNITSD